MSLESLNTLAQLLASLGVIGSLFYLAVQVRQSTRSSRAIVVDSLARSMHDLALVIAQDDRFLRILMTTLDNWEASDELERARASSFLLGYFKLFENAWFQMRKGMLERDQWEGYDTFLRMTLTHAGTKAWWKMRRGFFAPGFRDYVEQGQPVAGVPTLSEVVKARS